jgi:hypothetical protein
MYRIDTLLKQEEKLFHTNDLALLWGMKNKNTLYTTIKRYIDKGILIPIHKGFYSALPLEKINPFRLLNGFLHRFTYITTETILVAHGVIFQKDNYITAASNISQKFAIGQQLFLVRKLKDEFLFNNLGIKEQNGIYQANLERAVADILYFNPSYFFDNRKIINWQTVRKIQKEVGYR